mmetsp:Transcript_158711/g.280344  ORF Transcript_158711/g.280344 Transcript_158711/m.280344 type:complete len:207 (-) Transcript_158711:277-897(-)
MASSEATMSLHVVVHNLVGKEVQLEIPRSCAVKDLKALVREKWGLPSAAQHMLAETTMLENDWLLQRFCDEVPQGETLKILCVFSLPYEGDIQQASRAGDRDSVRFLMRERDKDRGTEPFPATLKLLMQPQKRFQKGWSFISEALTERGYTNEEVSAALQTLTDCTRIDDFSYIDVLHHLELNIRKIQVNEVHLATWMKGVSIFQH